MSNSIPCGVFEIPCQILNAIQIEKCIQLNESSTNEKDAHLDLL